MYPPQGSELIKLAVVAGDMLRRFCGQLGGGVVAEDAEAIVDADNDDVLPRERFAERRPIGRALNVAAAVYPDYDWQLCTRAERRCPDVEVETRFVGLHAGDAEHFGKPRARRLRAGRTVDGCLSDPGPARRGLRRFPAEIADRLRSEGYAEKGRSA